MGPTDHSRRTQREQLLSGAGGNEPNFPHQKTGTISLLCHAMLRKAIYTLSAPDSRGKHPIPSHRVVTGAPGQEKLPADHGSCLTF